MQFLFSAGAAQALQQLCDQAGDSPANVIRDCITKEAQRLRFADVERAFSDPTAVTMNIPVSEAREDESAVDLPTLGETVSETETGGTASEAPMMIDE